MKRTREEHDAERRKRRDARVLEAAVSEALAEGYQWMTRDGVAKSARVAVGCVNLAYGTMKDLKRAVVRYAIENAETRPELLEIVKDALANRSPAVEDAPPEIRQRAAALLA